jgi:hypothetical protein
MTIYPHRKVPQDRGEIFEMTEIHFETVVVENTIRIPDQYTKDVPAVVSVTLTPVSGAKIKYGTKTKAGMLSSEDFSAVKIDTKEFRFDREKANER